jgi:hypothetical protein
VGAGSGRVLRHLTSLPPRALADIDPVYAHGTIAADRSGRYLLIPGPGPDGHGEIFRWTFGMPHPVSVTRGAFDAAWSG